MIKNLTPVSTPYGDGIIVDPDYHGYYAVEIAGQFTWMLCDESMLQVIGDRPAWLNLLPLPVMVCDAEREAYGHVHDRMQDKESKFMEMA